MNLNESVLRHLDVALISGCDAEIRRLPSGIFVLG